MQDVYEYESVPAELTPEQSRYILGAQGCMWSEYIPTAKGVEYQLLPRLCALSEMVWSVKEQRHWPDFISRMPDHYLRLDETNANYRRRTGVEK